MQENNELFYPKYPNKNTINSYLSQVKCINETSASQTGTRYKLMEKQTKAQILQTGDRSHLYNIVSIFH